MESSVKHVHGFIALPVKYNTFCKSQHWLYCKEHSVREKNSSKPTDRTLFVLNIPPYFTEECVTKLFEECGPIEAIYFHSKPSSAAPVLEVSRYFPSEAPIKGFKVGYVVFKSASGLQHALKLNWKKPAVIWTDNERRPKLLERWKQDYDDSIPDVRELQAEIDSFMHEYDKKVADEKSKSKEKEGQPDDEGWITVTKRGRHRGFSRKESVEQNLLKKEGKKKAKKELTDFYSFQIRESKMKHLAELRHKFEEDKKRITQMRQTRRFKPY